MHAVINFNNTIIFSFVNLTVNNINIKIFMNK